MEEQTNEKEDEVVENVDSMVGQLAGFSVSSLMQMLQNDSRTTLVEVKGAGLQSGTIYFQNGEAIDASCGRLKGDDAALEMIGWDTVDSRFLPLPEQTPARTVKNTSMGLLMEGMRQRDERLAAQTDESIKQLNPKSIEGDTEMAGLKQLMKDISDEMDGVIAVGVVGMDGITVAAHNPTGVDMDIISAKFAMVMKLVERSVEDLSNLGNFEENLVQTANSWLLTRFLDKQYYLACIVSRDGTLGNVRLVAKKYLEQVQRSL
ncbi:MAG: DUF4388 domain-containing protein [Thermodesulfobacteriota bacterium]